MEYDAEKDRIFRDAIFAPTVVGIPPRFAARDMCFCADGAIRHYGRMWLNGQCRRIYAESRDQGLSWKNFPADPDDPGAMVRCPWADYWLSLQEDSERRLTAVRSSRGPGFPAEKRVLIGVDHQEPRPLLPLCRRKRWIGAVSDVSFKRAGCYQAAVCYSDDDGENWHYVTVPPVPGVERKFVCDKRPHWFNNGCEPTIAELADGTLLMALRTSGEYAAFTRSYDGGESWETPRPVSGFWQANTMPELHTLKDGRLLFVWNNTAMLPTRSAEETPELCESELSGESEVVFTNRDALHCAISEDQGKTWIGYRELILNEIRNNADFRELGNDPAQEHDKSVHQTQMLELPDGKILLAAGQNAASRRFILFDPAWLYERSRTENFQHGLGNISHHLYVRSASGNWRGWAGHCAWNRLPGVVMAKEPDPESTRESLWLCRIRDPRLVSSRSGFVWNFPALPTGSVELQFRIEGEGFQIALQDHWSNPCDEYLVPRSYLVTPVRPEEFSIAGVWATLRLNWDLASGTAELFCNGITKKIALKKEGFSPSGPSYLHIQTLAEEEDTKGTFFRELKSFPHAGSAKSALP